MKKVHMRLSYLLLLISMVLLITSCTSAPVHVKNCSDVNVSNIIQEWRLTENDVYQSAALDLNNPFYCNCTATELRASCLELLNNRPPLCTDLMESDAAALRDNTAPRTIKSAGTFVMKVGDRITLPTVDIMLSGITLQSCVEGYVSLPTMVFDMTVNSGGKTDVYHLVDSTPACPIAVESSMYAAVGSDQYISLSVAVDRNGTRPCMIRLPTDQHGDVNILTNLTTEGYRIQIDAASDPQLVERSLKAESCDKIANSHDKVTCLISSLGTNGALSACSSAPRDSQCLMEIARVSKDSLTCTTQLRGSLQKQCYDLVLPSCPTLEGDDQGSCYGEIAGGTNNARLCEQATSGKDTCYLTVAETIYDTDLCYLIHDKTMQTDCLENMDVYTEDSCLTEQAGHDRDKCYNMLAFYSDKRAWCYKITDPQMREDCLA